MQYTNNKKSANLHTTALILLSKFLEYLEKILEQMSRVLEYHVLSLINLTSYKMSLRKSRTPGRGGQNY